MDYREGMGTTTGPATSDSQATRQRRSYRGIFVLPLFLFCGIVLGVMALAIFARVATHGIWDHLAEYATGRPLKIDTSMPTVVNKIQRLQRLETVDYTMDKIVEGDRQSPIFPDFLAGDKLLLVTHGQVIAGVDMGQLAASSIHVDDQGSGHHSIRVHLPPAQIFVVRLDNSQTRVYSRTTGLFVPVDPYLESEVRSKAEDQFRQGALSDGILDKARQNAAASLTSMLLGLGFDHVVVN